ncbi:hypothetical protein GCM10025331_20820 [Actinoplanes utahensis]|nr:hypothetical protein Aut01nite_36560 [Actinoplanes utahensis]
MRHRVGSITKTFTAAAVLRQVERGRIDLDAPVGRYLPHLVPGERGRRITVRMLLNHTSGLPDYLPYAVPLTPGVPGRRIGRQPGRQPLPVVQPARAAATVSACTASTSRRSERSGATTARCGARRRWCLPPGTAGGS